ncbi:MAG: hypothetical protein JRE10_13185 [Deltaproteobacteria bacterium]|nr:hypothetical protein [Deltaproteobacteria bacterium]
MSGAVLSYQQKDPMIIIDSKSLPISVLATGKGWLVVDKPAGITVHNEPGRDVCSLGTSELPGRP